MYLYYGEKYVVATLVKYNNAYSDHELVAIRNEDVISTN